MEIESRDQHSESELNFEECEMKDDLKKAKEKFRKLCQKAKKWEKNNFQN